MKLKCLIVDDEVLAQRVVEKYIEDIPFLEVERKCKNAMEAMEVMFEGNIDLMFLDINMPKISGLDFLKTIKNPPFVIITTAYREYALEGFELDVTDYLKKPFSFERFLTAVSKVEEKYNQKMSRKSEFVIDNKTRQQIEESFIFVKEDKVTYKVDLNKILYIESVGDYVKIFTEEKVYLTYQSLKSLEKILTSEHFPRVHKSFMISISKINSIEGNRIKIGDAEIPIGRNYKQDFQNILARFS